MYHIKSDKRSQRSAELICRGFNRCILHHNFNQLTISQIIQESTVGRATFYRLFDSKLDVLAYQSDRLFKKAAITSSSTKSTKVFFLKCAQLCIKNHLLFETIINAHQAQIIYHTLITRLKPIKRRFKLTNTLSSQQMDYFLADLTQLIIGTLSTWIRHGEKESANELINTAANVTGIIYHSIK